MKTFQIQPVSRKLQPELQKRIDQKTKPLGALGSLENVALRIGLIQNTLQPQLKDPHIIVFSGDHGVTQEGVSAYPQEVTAQMVLNFLNGGAGINVFAKLNGLALRVVDSGVNFDFDPDLPLVHAKIRKGTRNLLKEPAMTKEECEQAIAEGARIVDECQKRGCNVIGFGEMGIGNTSSASVLTSLLCQIPIESCVGTGAGLDNEQLRQKQEILRQAIEFQNMNGRDALEVLTVFGGYELAMMTGAYLQAAQHRMVILVDGFISSAAFLAASHLYPDIKDYAFHSHSSAERGHRLLLDYWEVDPLLKLNLRLGEGTGAALAYPLLAAAVSFLNEMASFEGAGVSSKSEHSPCPEN